MSKLNELLQVNRLDSDKPPRFYCLIGGKFTRVSAVKYRFLRFARNGSCFHTVITGAIVRHYSTWQEI